MPFPVVPVLMAAATIGKGIAEQSRANKLGREATAAANAIPKEDPGVRAHLNQIEQRERYANNGQLRTLAVKRDMINDAGEQAGRNLIRTAGTSPGSTQQALLRNQAVTQRGLAQAGAESEATGLILMNMRTPLIQDIADRTLSLQRYLRDQKAFGAAQAQQNSNNLIAGGIGNLSGLEFTGGGWKSMPATAPSAPDMSTVASQIQSSVAGAPSSPSVLPNGPAPYMQPAQEPTMPFPFGGSYTPSWLQ